MITTDLDFLRKPCESASIIETDSIIKKLEEELNKSHVKGIGLSANQIGILKRVAIIRMDKLSINLVNPVIEKQYDLCSFNGDGCLSIPGIYLTTQRFNEILVRDLFHPAGVVLTGIEAVVAQHEIDHTNGILMLDRKIEIPGPNEKCWCGSDVKFKKCHSGQEIK